MYTYIYVDRNRKREMTVSENNNKKTWEKKEEAKKEEENSNWVPLPLYRLEKLSIILHLKIP